MSVLEQLMFDDRATASILMVIVVVFIIIGRVVIVAAAAGAGIWSLLSASSQRSFDDGDERDANG